jgi:simple sugar transport system ATP-binding protein
VLKSVDHARALGIECVYQDLALVPGLSIYHNMFLNREPLWAGPLRLLDNRAMRRRAAEALEDIGVNIPNVNEEVAMLSGGQRQAVAIARAVYSQAKILLLDEPLAAMGARESGLILDLIDRLKKRGDLSLIMIAHNYAQTLEVCDRIMMFQHGEVTFERAAAETSVPELLDVVKQNYKVIRGAH